MLSLPPQYGIYSGGIPVIIYGFLGTSRHLSVGSMSSSYIMISRSFDAFGEKDEQEKIEIMMAMSFFTGITLFLMGLFKSGYLEYLISHTTMNSYLMSAAILVSLEQFAKLLSIKTPNEGDIYLTIKNIITHAKDTHIPTLVFGIIFFFLFFFYCILGNIILKKISYWDFLLCS